PDDVVTLALILRSEEPELLERDNDQDGFVDKKDACPNQPEVFNDHEDEDGCPDDVVTLALILRSEEPELLERARLTVDGVAKEIIPGETTRFQVPPGHRALIEAVAENHHRLFEETRVMNDQRMVLTLKPIRWGDVRMRVTDPFGTPLAAQLIDPDQDIPAEGMTLRMPAGSNQLTVGAPGFQQTDLLVDVAANARQEVVVVLEPSGPWLEDTRLRVSDRIRFSLDSAELTDDSQSVLQDIADWLSAHTAIRLLRIEGFADEIGAPAYNHRLSIDRAQAVRRWLVDAGVSASRLEAIGSGEALADPSTHIADRSVGFLVVVWDADIGERPSAAILSDEDP
ncbi:MAG: OmpA family protein, partial [Myxococcota bacterium]